MARVAAQYAYMVSSDFESPEARYALGPYTPVDLAGIVHALPFHCAHAHWYHNLCVL